MLTKELFMELWESIQENGDDNIREAVTVAELASAYSRDLATLPLKDADGKLYRTLKWDEIPYLYRQELLKALLVEYGWYTAMQLCAPEEGQEKKPVQNKEPAAATLFYPAEHLRTAELWRKRILIPQPDEKNMLNVILGQRWEVFPAKPIDKSTKGIFDFVIDRVIRKTQFEGHKDYSQVPESRRVALTIYEIMERLGIKEFKEAEKAAETASVQFSYIFIKNRENHDEEKSGVNAFAYAAGSSYLFETGISETMAKAFEESWCKKEMLN